MSNLFAFGDKVIGGGESSQSDGHIIQNPSGTAMPTQPNLQFKDAKVTNDGTNQATVVQNFVDINWNDWQNVGDSDDTYYRVTDAPLVDGNVEVDLMKKLWENPAPTASFTPQTITLNSADYDFLMIIGTIATSEPFIIGTPITPKGSSALFSYGIGDSRYRALRYVSDTSYSVEHAYNGSTENDAICIPVAIYGIKQKVTISLSAIISNVSTSASKCMLSDGETSVEDALNYSTDEHIVGTWIDGSILYEKTIDCGALPNNGTKNVAHNISNLGNIISITGFGTGNTNIPLPWISTANQCTVYVRGTNIVIVDNDNLSAYNGYVTLRYTKTS